MELAIQVPCLLLFRTSVHLLSVGMVPFISFQSVPCPEKAKKPTHIGRALTILRQGLYLPKKENAIPIRIGFGLMVDIRVIKKPMLIVRA